MIEDPRLPWQKSLRTDLMEGGTILNIHNPRACEGGACTMHSRTAHSMRIFPQFWDDERKAIFRVCEHRQFHVDPDERQRVRNREACKNCCGCCG